MFDIRKIKDLLPLFALLVCVLFFFAPFLTGEIIPYTADYTGSDLTELNVPFRVAAAQGFLQGEFPLWTNLIASGFPLLAEGQAGVFYPFNILLYILLPVQLAVTTSFIIHFFLAALFTYFYARWFKLTRFAALFSALAFAFSGFFIFRIKHVNLINAAIWLPLVLLTIEWLLVTKKKILGAIFISLILAVQFFAGHPQISYITVLTSLFYYGLRYYQLFRPIGMDRLKIFGRDFVTTWVLVGVITFGLSAVQLFPTLELMTLSVRGEGLGFSGTVNPAFNPAQFATAFMPFLFGNPATGDYRGLEMGFAGGFWESSVFVGIITVILAAIALVSRLKNSRVIFFGTLLLFSLFFILAKFNILYTIVWPIIPGLSVFRFPQRFLLVFIFALAILGGIGFDVVRRYCEKRFTKIADPVRMSVGASLIILLILIIELFGVGFKYVGFLSSEYLERPASYDVSQDDDYRIASLGWRRSWPRAYDLSDGWLGSNVLYLEHRALMQPNLSLLYGVATVNDRGWGEGGQLPRPMVEVLDGLVTRATVIDGEDSLMLSDEVVRTYGLLNAKYLLSLYQLESSYLVESSVVRGRFLPPVHIYENLLALPYAFAVFDTAVASDASALFDESFDPTVQAIIENPIELAGVGQGNVDIIRRDHRYNEFAVDFTDPGILVVSQSYYPGWLAYIDGQRTDVLKINHALTGIAVPAGSHSVSLAYKPLSFTLGLSLSIITLIVVLLLLYFRDKQIWLPKRN